MTDHAASIDGGVDHRLRRLRPFEAATGPLNRHQSLNAFGQDRHPWEEAKPCTRNFERGLGRHRLPDWKAW
jgi:hypothetical protein